MTTETTRRFVIRDVSDPWAFRDLEDVQVAAWGYHDREVTPGTLFRVSAVTGGIVLAAYPDGGPDAQVPVGLAYGFPAVNAHEQWHHSHLLAIRPQWRGTGMAVALKQAQRERALAQGLSRMTWTFDPLVARNARLNLGKLGARATQYLPDWYALEDNRTTAFPADRFLIEWDLNSPGVGHAAPEPQDPRVLEEVGGQPRLRDQPATAVQVLAEVPVQSETLERSTRLAWRLALRECVTSHMARGYTVTDLAREADRAFYVLTQAEQP
ncbi:acyl-CoA N-acyltransferase [Deinococcus malanensis]|uniref:Acyl-CoA N-acyltransferase n=1 Tax=Deinococcus malanensis TaxID=1706855 RepID=A0ABQ2EZK8_9DEIO|nr:acyl-CoA acyltransferase [Deinococcus malanensis]GGK28569.1 acyl-CoA N-acyltransferase [Deinococcus malanensis]